MDAATAGFRVGYLDASHFSRDYKKLFGKPPARDVENMRNSVGISRFASRSAMTVGVIQ